MAPPSIHKDGVGGSTQTNQTVGHYGKQSNNDNNQGGGSKELTPEQLQNKIFVGGLPLHLTKDGLHNFFSQFGTVTDSIIMMDAAQNRSRGFGFVTFENGTGGAQKALKAQPLYIDNKYVEIKLATPKGDQNHGNRPKYHNNTSGLRNANAASMVGKGEFAGLAASFGRNGWRAGYGTIAFGSYGWNVKGWEDISKAPEKSGFSFDLLDSAKRRKDSNRKRAMGEQERESKRLRQS